MLILGVLTQSLRKRIKLTSGSEWIRTTDQRLMSPLLCRLSYAAIEAKSQKLGVRLALFLPTPLTPAGRISSSNAIASDCIPSII
jgi:hypothetical protein